jgi:hypothetical protein
VLPPQADVHRPVAVRFREAGHDLGDGSEQ